MKHMRRQGALVFAAALALGGGGRVRADDGDVTLSGTLRYNAVFENAGSAQTTYEASLLHYVFEAGPSTAGVVQPLDVAAVESLCGDKDGCQITLQMHNWDPTGEPGATASITSRLFLAPSTGQWRFDDLVYGHAVSLKGVDGVMPDSGPWRLYDCNFADSETPTAINGTSDNGTGFGLLNCSDSPGSCGAFSDDHTVCRVVLRD